MLTSFLLLASTGFSSAAVLTHSDSNLGFTFAGLALLMILSAFFSGTETATFSLQAIDREVLKTRGKKGRLLERLRSRPRRLLATILMGNELVNVSLSSLSAGMIAQLVPDRPWVNILVVTPFLVLFGEVVPKNLAFRFRRTWALWAAQPLALFYFLITPLRWLFTQVIDKILHVFGVRGQVRSDRIKEEQLRKLVDQGLEQGSIKEMEQELVHAVFEFGDQPVSRVMTPRPDLVMLELYSPFDEILETVRLHPFSRLPVYSGGRDNVLGVLMTKDLLRLIPLPHPKPSEIRKILHPAFFVPTFKRMDDLLKEMRSRKLHMAMVVDEHGSISGLVTMDDLLGELMGEVQDEKDLLPEGPVREQSDGTLLIRASMTVDDFSQLLGISLPPGGYNTLGGFVLSELGEIPRPGQKLEWSGLTLEVAEISGRRITTLRVHGAGNDGGGS